MMKSTVRIKGRYCGRCHCAIPFSEWKPLFGGHMVLKHLGPMRDHDPLKLVEPDEAGEMVCEWMMNVPELV